MTHTHDALPRSLWRGALLAAIGAIALATACKGNEPAKRRARSAAADPAATEAPAGGSGESDLDEIRGYRLRMDKIRRFYDAGARLAAAARGMDSAQMKLDADDGSPQTVDAMAAQIERLPVARAAIEGAGLSAREYALISLSYMQAAMAGAVAEQQRMDDATAAEKMKASADNIRFVREHKAELERLQREAQAKIGGAGGS